MCVYVCVYVECTALLWRLCCIDAGNHMECGVSVAVGILVATHAYMEESIVCQHVLGDAATALGTFRMRYWMW